MNVIINNKTYNVGVAAVSRSIRRENKYKVVTEDGVVHREVRATYVDFDLKLGNIDAPAYDTLMADLLAAVDDVTVELPTGQTTTEVYIGTFNSVSDSLLLENEEGAYYDNLTLAFDGTVPVEVDA